MTVITKKITVSGVVQMVGYRWFAKQRADICNIRGYARNMSRGEVEILAQGNESDIQTYMEHLKIGPSRARVDRITSEAEKTEKIYSEFNIRM